MSRSLLQQRNINLAPYPVNNSPSIAVFEYSGTDPLPSPTADVNFYYLNGNGIGVVNLQIPPSNTILTSQQLFIINIDSNQVIGLFAELGSSINNILSPSIWLTLGANEGTLLRKTNDDKFVGIRLPTGFTLSNNIPTGIAIGNSGNAGISPQASRSDHTHALPEPGSPVSAGGATNIAGISTNVARQDHKHRLELQVEELGIIKGSRPTINFSGATISDNPIFDRIDINIQTTPLTNNNPSTLTIGVFGNPGISTEAARSDHIHAFPAPGAPSNVNKTASLAGVSTKVAREDHKHNIDTSTPSTASGTINSEGTSTSLARADHIHRTEIIIEKTGIVIGSKPILNFTNGTISDDAINDRVNITLPDTPLSNNTPTSLSIGNVGSPGVSSEASRSDHTHAFPSPNPPVNVNKAPSSAGISANAAREDHKHNIDTNVPATVSGSTNSEGTALSLARSDHVHRLALTIQDNGILVGSKPILNFKGASIVDDNINDRVDITITPTPLSNNLPVSINIGDSGTAGASSEAARSDHQHPLAAPSAPSTAGGNTNIAGVSSNTARADHVHRIEVNVQSNGIAAASRPTLNFVNATVTDEIGPDRATITIPIAPSPLIVTANSTVALSGVEATLMSGNITLPSDTTGRIFVSFTGMISIGAITTGTNGGQIRLRVAGNIVSSSVRQYQYTATAGVNVAFDRTPISVTAIITGLSAGINLVEVLAIKLGAVSTASIAGERILSAHQI